MRVSGVSGVGVALRVRPPDLVRLHARQMIWMLSGVSCPPLECGVMWSASALAGVYGVVWSSHWLQCGQCVWLLACACLIACVRRRRHLPVPVLLVAMSPRTV